MGKKNIIIDNKKYSLDLIPVSKGGFSGVTYHLKEDGLDLAVKLYNQYSNSLMDYSWYPEFYALEYFIKVSDYTYPVLLSKFVVTDEDDNYIGCASPFIYETRGNIEECIFKLPREMVLNGLLSIINTVPIFNKAQIVLDDWNINNMKFGNIQGLGEAFYMFDDSNYRIGDTSCANNLIANALIEDIIADFCITNHDIKINDRIMDDMGKRADYIDFLIDRSNGFENIGDFLDDYAKTLKKKYY